MPAAPENDPTSPVVTASCHCGTIQLTFPEPTVPLNECLCSTCLKTAGRWAYYPIDQVQIKVTPGSTRTMEGEFVTPHNGPSQRKDTDADTQKDYGGTTEGSRERAFYPQGPGSGISSYIWGDEYLHTCRCEHCGCVTHWVRTEKFVKEFGEGNTRMGVNCRMLEPAVQEGLEVKVTSNWD